MLDLFTDDRKHEQWWMAEIAAHRANGPAHYNHVLPLKPFANWPTDVRGMKHVGEVKDAWTAQEGG